MSAADGTRICLVGAFAELTTLDSPVDVACTDGLVHDLAERVLADSWLGTPTSGPSEATVAKD